MQITQGDWFAVKGEKEKHNSIANYYNTYTQQHLYFKKEGMRNVIIGVKFVLLLPCHMQFFIQ